MQVRDAVGSRYSCRAFLPTPVHEKTVRDIIELAARAPSAGNTQPWRIDAIAGDKLESLKELLRPRMGELPRGEGAQYTIYPPETNSAFRKRSFEVGELSTSRSICRARISRRSFFHSSSRARSKRWRGCSRREGSSLTTNVITGCCAAAKCRPCP